MGQLDSTCTGAHQGQRLHGGDFLRLDGDAAGDRRPDGVEKSFDCSHVFDGRVRLGVAVQQVEFESKSLKPGDHISGSRVETRQFQGLKPGGSKLWFNLNSRCAQPHLGNQQLRRRDDDYLDGAARGIGELHLRGGLVGAVQVKFESKL
jgi:hypothetical protein